MVSAGTTAAAAAASRQQQRQQQIRLGRRRGARSNGSNTPLVPILGLLLGLLLVLLCFASLFVLMRQEGESQSSHNNNIMMKQRKPLPLPELDHAHNFVARDVLQSLSCDMLHVEFEEPQAQEEEEQPTRRQRRRRLDQEIQNDNEIMTNADQEEEEEQQQAQEEEEKEVDPMMMMMPAVDDDAARWGSDEDFHFQPPPDHRITAKHLLCLAAGAQHLPPAITTTIDDGGAFACGGDVRHSTRRKELLMDVWSAARTEMTLELLEHTLELAVETTKMVLGETLHLWAPHNDQSLDFLENEINKPESAMQRLDGVFSSSNQDDNNNHLFIDVGSGLGVSTLAVAKKYPHVSVVSLEPAAPSWLLQKINLACNLDLNEMNDNLPQPILAGVGDQGGGSMAKMMWRPSSTRTTRAWSPKLERQEDDVELVVRLRSIQSLLKDHITTSVRRNSKKKKKKKTVMNVDCEGCEYNLVPSLTEPEWRQLDVVLGTTGVHWGYIPLDKLPSSKRAKTTHERLCGHYDYARQCVECCAFVANDLQVTVPGEKETHVLSSVVPTELCGNFDAWAREKHLFTSNDDYGWSELSSMSGMA